MSDNGGREAATAILDTDDDGPAAVTLDGPVLDELMEFGDVRSVAPGDVLYRAGAEVPAFFVVLEGEVEIVRQDDNGEEVVARHGQGRFLGELNLLTGQRTYLAARVSRSGRVLAIDLATFRQLINTKPDFSDTVFKAFVARRELLRTGAGAGAIRIIGSRYSPEAMALRAFANRYQLPHRWIDLEDIDDPPVYLAGIGVRPPDVPVVVTPTALLRRPTPGQFAENLGLTYRPVPGYISDLVVVGTGPAGLSAAVYG
ncbi:MAG: cyclic nucleotide-binding domain-containing protein, partial [Actinomycetota bacterium]|nr:cyclic nucleotide-binding domain-containing protein [Actinomycetota bacterium]